MRALVFYTSTDRAGLHDSSGAFKPEALAFAKLHGVPKADLVPIPQNIPVYTRRYQFRQAIQKRAAAGQRYDAVVYFGHGTKTSLPGIGYSNGAKPSGTAEALATEICKVLNGAGVVVLYACSAGAGFGFADALAEQLTKKIWGVPKVVVHLTPGHVSKNPYTEVSGVGPLNNGLPIIPITSPQWQAWIEALQTDQRFRLSFPFLTPEQILEYLGGAALPTADSVFRCPQCGHEVVL